MYDNDYDCEYQSFFHPGANRDGGTDLRHLALGSSFQSVVRSFVVVVVIVALIVVVVVVHHPHDSASNATNLSRTIACPSVDDQAQYMT